MKAIIMDLDRTLLRTDKSVSSYTVDVLHECRACGLLLFAASARPLRDILPYEDRISFDAVTAANGAIIRLPGGTVECGIPRESCEKILSRLLRHSDVFLSVETSVGLYSNRDIPAWQPIVCRDFPNLPENVSFYKILASSEKPYLYQNIESVLTGDVYHTIANGTLVQIMHRDATKWNGVVRMLACFGLAPEDAVYFGDDNDDLAPMQNCGLGVAVANAIPSVLAAADAIARSNDQDGVAHYIKEHIL